MTGETRVPTVGRNPKRRQEILAATRTLFDESGSRYAQVDDIARAVGISRAIIYRHFSSKEELFAEVLVTYLSELKACFSRAEAAGGTPEQRLENLSDAILDFGLANPAFIDCGLGLVRRPGGELREQVGDAIMVRLGEAMWPCIEYVVAALKDGVEEGVFDVPDPVLLANLYYTQALGILAFATLQISVGLDKQGHPEADKAPIDEIKRLARRAAIGQARSQD